ncbi:hypothetical protein IWT140_00952 [Secundilactobacillus pentosiphilus]|uniref:Uncharacterized protein n=1 Tax=Secundilactobacillus pentosiphilus TaxID=1714682 RepID=A0A1Z5INN2_9LACO|nr:hypothetical protein IWT140_00952 [Secundilactobacillus pentosiphilus]
MGLHNVNHFVIDTAINSDQTDYYLTVILANTIAFQSLLTAHIKSFLYLNLILIVNTNKL